MTFYSPMILVATDRIKKTESRFADNQEPFFNTIGQTRSFGEV